MLIFLFYTYYPLESNGCFFMVALRYSDFVLRYSGTFHCALRLAISSPMLSHLTRTFVFFGAAGCAPRAPAAGYDPERCNAGAWCQAAVVVSGCFSAEFSLHPSSFLRNDESNLPPDFATLGYCRSLLSQFTIPQTPHFFKLSVNI